MRALKMNELIKKYYEIKEQLDNLKNEQDVVKAEIRLNMKTQELDFFESDNETQITLRSQTRESLDKKKVQEYLSTEQYFSVIKTSTFDVLKITTKEQRELLKKIITK